MQDPVDQDTIRRDAIEQRITRDGHFAQANAVFFDQWIAEREFGQTFSTVAQAINEAVSGGLVVRGNVGINLGQVAPCGWSERNPPYSATCRRDTSSCSRPRRLIPSQNSSSASMAGPLAIPSSTMTRTA